MTVEVVVVLLIKDLTIQICNVKKPTKKSLVFLCYKKEIQYFCGILEVKEEKMKEDKMHLINKLFNNETIRTVWDKDEEKYYISVVDIVGILSESKDGRKYWNKLKQRLKFEGNESVTNCHQLKLKSSDGKYYNTDVCDIEEMFRIIESIPSKNAEPIKQWLSR